jgi:hypothetical protein
MTKWAPAKTDTLDALATEILHNYGNGRAAVAIDGPSDAGTAAFADELAAALERAGHAASRATVPTSVDAATLQSEILAPFKTEDGSAILVVNGLFLNRPELAGYWNYSVWLERARVTDDGTDADLQYRSSVNPRRVAVAIVDNADPEHPRRVFADAC